MTTSPGSASPGRSRCGANPSISTNIAAALDAARGARPRLSRASARARRSSRRAAREARTAAPGRAIPTARRSIRASAAISTAAEAERAHRGGRRPRLAPRHGRRRSRPRSARSPIAASTPDGAESVVAAQPERWGDAVIARKEVPTSYHLSVVVDDALQGVTHVVRGQDLEAATDLHVLLQDLLGLPTPRYHHHPLDPRPRRATSWRRAGCPKSLAELRAKRRHRPPRIAGAGSASRRHPTPST